MKKWLVSLLAFAFPFALQAQQPEWLAPFSELYKKELGSLQACSDVPEREYRVCSQALKNEGNSPYVLHHNAPTDKVAVLFHGLSDSPFFYRSIAPTLHKQGYTVLVALLPGHGKLDADEDMEDPELGSRWASHVAEVLAFANSLGDQVVAGGFSTGGALAVDHLLDAPQDADKLLLFSGALALDESVESMSRYWGIRWLAKLMDGHYDTAGPNPYKYPGVSRYSAIVLTDVIFSIREKFDAGKTLQIPVFTAHSMADTTTPWRGIEMLLAKTDPQSTRFVLEESLDVCHADVVISDVQLLQMEFDARGIDPEEKCRIPKSNPKHKDMLNALTLFLQED